MSPRGVALACLAGMAAAHPGTWDGKVIMNLDGAPLPDLTGAWSDGHAQMVLQLYQPPMAAAVPPNSTYAVRADLESPHAATCTLTPVYDYATRRRLQTLIECLPARGAGPGLGGRVPGRGVLENGTVAWRDGSRWLRHHPGTVGQHFGRFSGIHTVHVVFMNHYDVGYTDYINGVDNTYMHKYFALAEETAQKMRANRSDAFVYTTHPWLMERYLSCPCPDVPCLATSLNNSFEPPLRCPSEQEVANFTAAVERGDIVWNGAPFNIQPENMSPELFLAGAGLVRRMDRRFGRGETRTMSIRDVIYVTSAVLPLLKKVGITGLTIGSNGADFPPQVPKLHRWVDPVSGADIVVAYHPYGYGGYNLKDCAESPNGVALCTEFRSDNKGPPSSVREVEATLESVRKEYPGAVVKPSTFDHFMADVMPVKHQLPVVEAEVGDTWTYGNPSDPLKVAQYRAIQRAWLRCLHRREPRCSPEDPAIQNMTFFLLKAPEHTWGAPGISGWGHGDDYNTSRFHRNLTSEGYMRAAASWAEQRLFNELAVRALEEASHPLAAEAREELALVETVSAPDTSGCREVPPDTRVTMADGTTVGFRGDGAMTTLDNSLGSWASSSAPMAAFVYQTFNDSEWGPFTYAYLNDHQMQPGFCKPGSNNFSESALWRPRLARLMVEGRPESAASVVAVLAMPERAWAVYGAPRAVYLNVTSGPAGVHLAFTAVGKQPTMIGESTMVTFRPAPTLRPVGAGSAWRLDKLGGAVDPESVRDGGNQFTHGVWQGATVHTDAGRLSIEPVDAMNMNPMTDDYPIGNPLPASYGEAAARGGTGLSRLAAGSVRGMAANLHNNLWNTNYALFYPYFDARFCASPLACSNSNALYRFRLTFEAAPPAYI